MLIAWTLLFTGCTLPIPKTAGAEVPAAVVHDLGLKVHIEAISRHRSSIAALENPSAAAPALAGLATTCPWNRLMQQVPRRASVVVAAVPESHLEPAARPTWRQLVLGLRTHVAVLDAMGSEVPILKPGDVLYGRVDALEVAVQGGPLDPEAFVNQIDTIVASYDNAVYDVLEQHREGVRKAVGDIYPLQDELKAWTQALQTLEKHVTDAASRRDIERLNLLLGAFARTGC